jgi:rhamnulokinase
VADATGRLVIAGPAEATAFGNILVQAMGAGEVKGLDGVRAAVRNSCAPAAVEPGAGGSWDDAYARYREVVGA